MKSHDGRGAHWHILLWISVVTIVFSVTTMSLAATPQETVGAYTANTAGILRALADLRREIRDIAQRVARIENIVASRNKTSFVAPSEQEKFTSVKKYNSVDNTNTDNSTRAEASDEAPKDQVAIPQKTAAVIQNETLFQQCGNQCYDANKTCVAAAGTTYNSPNEGWINPICKAFHEECFGLCADWYAYPNPTKLPVPPIQNQEQTCLLICHAKRAWCLNDATDSQLKIQCENQYTSCKKICPIIWEARRAL